ncbi:hypothetical protein M0R72_20590 [Candidatus Pacearchaeota archaeon]|jgi:hypothetical protein|nr:hypothetical protein [Candidatus Pacearchaeota archaeon]
MIADEVKKMNKMVQIIMRHGDFAYGNDAPEEVAIEWNDWDISPDEVDAWLSSRCFDPEAAHQLEDYDITPAQAGKITERGLGNYKDTIGYKVSNNDLTIEEAIEESEVA